MLEELYMKGHYCTLPDLLRKDSLFACTTEDSLWTRTKRWWRRNITVSSHNPNTKIIFRSMFACKSEQRRHLRSKHHWVIHPLSSFRIYWEMFMLFTSAVIVTVYALEMGFESFAREFPNSLYFLTFVDTACMLDLILAFVTGYVVRGTREVVLDSHKIARRYLKIHFFFNILASLPQKLIIDLVAKDVINSKKLLLLLKMYHVRTLTVYTRSFCFLVGIGAETYMLMKIAIFMMLSLHWMACLYMLVPVVARDVRGYYPKLSWLLKMKFLNHRFEEIMPFKKQYSICFYQASCVMMGQSFGLAFPDASEDYALQIMAYLYGHLAFGFIFVVFLNKAMSFTNRTVDRMELLSEVDEYMKHKHFTRPIQRRLKMFYKFHTFRSHYRQETVNSTLTERLKLEIQLYCNMKTVDTLSIFRELPHRIMKLVLPFMTEEVYLPNDIICRAGTEGDFMCFVVSGTLAMVSQNGHEYGHMQDGDFFGEIELILKDQRRFCTVIAIEICQVLLLEKRHFIRCFTSDLDVYTKLIHASINRLVATTTETEFIKKKMILTIQNLEGEKREQLVSKRYSTVSKIEVDDAPPKFE